jgi:hypothetical protein
MRNFLAFVGAAIVVFLGLGWYLGWYNITPEKTDTGKTRIQVDINKDKISNDVKRGASNVEGFIEKQKAADTSKPTDKTDKDAPASGAKLQQPADAKTTSRAKETFGPLITDGWFGGEKK